MALIQSQNTHENENNTKSVCIQWHKCAFWRPKSFHSTVIYNRNFRHLLKTDILLSYNGTPYQTRQAWS